MKFYLAFSHRTIPETKLKNFRLKC